MGRKLDVESEVIVYLGMKHLVLLEGVIHGNETRVSRYQKLELPGGFQQGLVNQLGDASTTLQNLFNQMFPQTNSELLTAWMVLGNTKLRQHTFQSSLYFQGDSRSISHREVRSVIQQTRTVATLPLSDYVLQTLPESFLVDDMPGVRNPIGLEAKRLGVNLNIFTMNYQEYKNLVKVVDSSDFDISGYIPKCLSISEAVLTDEEKKQGVLVLDLTSENTELIFWSEGALSKVLTLPFSGKMIDQKIAEHFNIDIVDAEKLKIQYGSLLVSGNADELIPLIEREGKQSRQIKRSEFLRVVHAILGEWYKGLISEVHSFVNQQGSKYPHFVFTGGGASLDGLIEFLFKEYSIVARIGLPKRIDAPTELLVDPALAPALGTFRWLSNGQHEKQYMVNPSNFFEKTITSARDWLLAYF